MMTQSAENNPSASRGLLRRCLSVPRRMARRKGFGIHSPFAFDFVRRVIAQPCAYYAYERINGIAETAAEEGALLRLLFRVCLYFRPRRIVVCGSVSDAVMESLIMGSPDAVSGKFECGAGYGDDTLLVIASCDEVDRVAVVAALKCGANAVILDAAYDSGLLADIWHGTVCGMLFRGRKAGIYAGMRHLPHQSFDVWF